MMRIKKIKPSEIITTKDFPVHNEHILKIYFKVCKTDPGILPLTPVISLSKKIPFSKTKDKKSKDYNKKLKGFLEKNKRVKYLMIDGSHKTTALTLTGNDINCMIIEKDEDIFEIRQLIEAGEVFSLSSEDTIKDILNEMENHFKTAKFLETVESKTLRMINKKVIPKFMIDYYQNEKQNNTQNKAK